MILNDFIEKCGYILDKKGFIVTNIFAKLSISEIMRNDNFLTD